MSEVIGAMISPEPLLIIRGVSESFKNLNKAQTYFISHGSNMAKKTTIIKAVARGINEYTSSGEAQTEHVFRFICYIFLQVCVCVFVLKSSK